MPIFSSFSLLFWVAMFLLLAPSLSQFDTTRMRIVHQPDSSHVLVRGNLPIVNNTFQFEQLYRSISALTGMEGYRLVIYSLLNLLTAKETKSRYIEEGVFDHEGVYRYAGASHQYYNHDIIGSYFSPDDYPQILKKYAIKYYNFTTYDKIPLLLQKIQRNLRSPIKTVVYVHCSQGIDRAGYVAGAYKMKNLGYSLQQVIKENLQVMKSVRQYIHFNSFYGMQWYCLYLKKNDQECLVGVQGARWGKFGQKEAGKETQEKQEINKDKKQQKQQKPEKQQKKYRKDKKQKSQI